MGRAASQEPESRGRKQHTAADHKHHYQKRQRFVDGGAFLHLVRDRKRRRFPLGYRLIIRPTAFSALQKKYGFLFRSL